MEILRIGSFVVAAFNQIGKEIIIITAYEPDEDHFELGKIRRKL